MLEVLQHQIQTSSKVNLILCCSESVPLLRAALLPLHPLHSVSHQTPNLLRSVSLCICPFLSRTAMAPTTFSPTYAESASSKLLPVTPASRRPLPSSSCHCFCSKTFNGLQFQAHKTKTPLPAGDDALLSGCAFLASYLSPYSSTKALGFFLYHLLLFANKCSMIPLTQSFTSQFSCLYNVYNNVNIY